MSERVLLVGGTSAELGRVGDAIRATGATLMTRSATSAADAARLLAEIGHDVAVLAGSAEAGSALDVVRDARAAGVRAPIVLLTGARDTPSAAAAEDAGVTDILPLAEATPERVARCLHAARRLHLAEERARVAVRERAEAVALERRARRDAEAAQRRLAFLAEAGALVAGSLEYEETLQNVARLAVPVVADWCFVDVLDENGAFTRMAVAHRDPAQAATAARLRGKRAGRHDGVLGIGRVTATGRSEVLARTPHDVLVSLAHDAEHLALLQELAASSVMMVPLAARGRTLGAMTFLASGPTAYTPQDLAFAEELARRAALAVDNARLFDAARQAEDGVRRQLDLTTAITGSIAEGVYALDRHGRFIFVNPAAERILGVDAAQLLRGSLSEIMPSRAGAARVLDGILRGRVVRVDDTTFRGPGGASLPISLVASPIITDGHVTGGVVAFHDATERKRAQAELEASRRELARSEKLSALGTLVSGVAHELRTPLTFLSNNLFLLQSRLDAAAREDARLGPLTTEVRGFCDAALEGVDRLNALVRDLRPFAKTDAGRRLDVSLHEVVGGAVDLFRTTHRGRVDVAADLRPTSAVLLDKGQLQRVVINLLLNAADSMPDGGTVRIVTRDEGGEAIVEVADRGNGIPPEIEPRIFDPFFTTKPDGTGLGLAITRRIVEGHGGEVRYISQPGHGTTFTVRLPFAARPPPGAGARELAAGLPGGGTTS